MRKEAVSLLQQVHSEERDKIIFGRALTEDDYMGGCCHFNQIDLEQLEKLVSSGFIELDEAQNDSPTTEEFLELMRAYPDIRAHGYVISPERDDYRVTLEGVRYEGKVTSELRCAFLELCRMADEFACDDEWLYAWWD